MIKRAPTVGAGEIRVMLKNIWDVGKLTEVK